jgi:tight adherence protein B
MIEDYNKYHCTARDYLIITTISLTLCLCISYLFYQKLFFAIFISPYSLHIIKSYQKNKVIRRKDQLTIQFRDAIQAISSALEAGYSMENAIRSSITDLELMYEKDALILIEFRRMAALMKNNTSVEEAMEQFANRTKMEDILCFSEVFYAAKRTGGDLVHIIRSTSKTIAEKIEIHREIETLITAKKLEAQIMKFMPIVILLYFTVCNPSYLQPLYHNFFGIGFMTIMLILCFGISQLADSIMKIEI